MKKICILAFSIIFLLSFNTSFAKSDLAGAKDLMATSSSKTEVNYELPYPGLLPDNPMYLLRIIRDKTVSFLIADPLKKAEFNLLQADKRLNAGIYLFNKGKISLAITTISKGENYFEEAMIKKREAEKQGMDIKDIETRLMQAVAKHHKELDSLAKRASRSFKASFETELKRVTEFQKELIR